jgi:predicted nucleic acid-binding protein
MEFGEECALRAIGSMGEGAMIDLDRKIAIDAAILSAELKLSMADSIILATARAYDATLWTQDAHFEEIEGVRYVEKKGR